MMKRYLPLFLLSLVLLSSFIIIPVNAEVILDSYSTSNINTDSAPVQLAGAIGIGQCFTPSSSGTLTSAGLGIKRVGTIEGTWSIRIYSITGTYGTSCIPDALLADSLDFTGATVQTIYTMYTASFDSSNQIPLTFGTNYAILLTLISFAPTPCCDSLNHLVLGIDSTSPTHPGNQFTCLPSCTASSSFDASFQINAVQVGAPTTVTQCYGNCGTPPITVVNTNTTKTINFNQSITLFYQAQSNLNGFVVNTTATVGRTYSNFISVLLGLYTVDVSCTATNLPFSTQCPGFLQKSTIFLNPAKGRITMITNTGIQNGQWFGISVSASFQGLELNDTNTDVPMYQTAGITPQVISSFLSLGNRKTQVAAFVNGISILTPVPSPTEGCGTLLCALLDLIDGFGMGRVAGGLLGLVILFSIMVVGITYATRQQDKEGNITGYWFPMEGFILIFLFLTFAFSTTGILPAWVPILTFLVVAWLFAESIQGRRRNQ